MSKRRLSSTERLSLDAMYKRRQRIAFDANMQKVYQYNSAYTIACLK